MGWGSNNDRRRCWRLAAALICPKSITPIPKGRNLLRDGVPAYVGGGFRGAVEEGRSPAKWAAKRGKTQAIGGRSGRQAFPLLGVLVKMRSK